MSSLPESSSLEALLHGAGFAPLSQLGWLRITGEDRVRWLNGMTTNSVQALQPGEGCYTFFLNAQGRIQADAMVWMQHDAILLQTANPATLAELLDRFIIMDDVELENHSMDGTGLALIGPYSETLLAQLGFHASLPQLHFEQQPWPRENGPAPVRLVHSYSPITPQFELWSDPATIGLLAESLRAAGSAEATPEALEQLRILSGTPLFGTDIRDRDLPQETAPAGTQSRALHFAKGCYLGQEIVERIHSRGNVHRTFTGFVLTGELPAPGTALMLAGSPEKTVGEITSVALVGEHMLALGYVRREALALTGQTATPAQLVYQNGSAIPSALPLDVLHAGAIVT